MKQFICAITLLLLVSCNNNNPSGDYSNSDNTESEHDIDYTQTYNDGYNNGYPIGYDDGRIAYSYKYSYNDNCNYSGESKKSYQEGYKEGYDNGYKVGKAKFDAEADERLKHTKKVIEEYEEEQRKQDYHNWERDEIEGFYVELDDCESDEEAQYISNEYYLGEYIKENGRYFAKVSQTDNGAYKASTGEWVSYKLFGLKNTDMFILFKYHPSVSSWEEGVLEVWGDRGVFYKKPN